MDKCIMGLPSIKKAENFTHNQAGNIAEEIFFKEYTHWRKGSQEEHQLHE